MRFRITCVEKDKIALVEVHEIEFSGKLCNLWRKNWFVNIMERAMLHNWLVTISRCQNDR